MYDALYITFVLGIPAILLTSIPVVAILTAHMRKLAEIRSRASGDEKLQATVEALRQEMRELRETATQFDLSFDAALERLERRIERLERVVAAVEQHAESVRSS